MELQELTKMLQMLLSDPDIANKIYIAAIIIVGIFIFRHSRRFKKEEELPDDIRGMRLSGIVTSVPDGDGFSFYHVPLCGLSEYTEGDPVLTIRLAGIDAPECASPDMPSQPFSKAAKEHLSHLVLRKNVSLKLIKRDMYRRLLAICTVKKFLIWPVNVNLKMVEDGLACVYKGADAQYDGLLDDFKKAEVNAKIEKLGMWSHNHCVSPMDHKRKFRNNT